VTLRKTILSILYIFLDEMLVIVAGIFLLFIGYLLHTNFVPFKRKFHNLMDYFVIIVTMATLFFGLLFYVDRFPDGTKAPLEYLAFTVIIGSTLIVVSMILWDANTRRKVNSIKLTL
jgi:divalent metal cation (Fe/Co/Zn/Cd) transporter